MKFLKEIDEQEITKLFEGEDKIKEMLLETEKNNDTILAFTKVMLELIRDKIQKIHIAPAGD